MPDSFELSLCQMQGHLFVLSAAHGFDSEFFIKTFMNSDIAAELDKQFSHTQWAGEEYLLSRFAEEHPEVPVNTSQYDTEMLYWSGYIYRYWHFYTAESSKAIYKQAPASLMEKVYLMFHTMSIEMAIDRLKETFADKHK